MMCLEQKQTSLWLYPGRGWQLHRALMLQSLWRLRSDTVRADRQDRVIRHAGRPVFQDHSFILLFMPLLPRPFCSRRWLSIGLNTQPSILSHLTSVARSALPRISQGISSVVQFLRCFTLLLHPKVSPTDSWGRKIAFLYKVMVFNITVIQIFLCSLQALWDMLYKASHESNVTHSTWQVQSMKWKITVPHDAFSYKEKTVPQACLS